MAAAGGALGLLVAKGVADFFHRMPLPFDLPVVFDMGVDRRVLLFTIAVSIFSTMLFGLVPALQITRPNLVSALKAADADSAGKRRFWGRNTIVAGQVALSLVLLAISAVMVQGFRGQLQRGPGFRTDGLFTTHIDTQLAHYTLEQSQRFFSDLLVKLRAEPGVKSAVLTSAVPMMGADTLPILPSGYQLPRGQTLPAAFDNCVSEGYFVTMGTPILQGRGFLESDNAKTPMVAVVNEHLADHFWPKGDAIGKRLHLYAADGDLVEIVGVAKMAKYLWIAEPPVDFVYLPYRQHPRMAMAFLAESVLPDAAGIAPVVRAAVRVLDPDMPVYDVRTMRDFYTQRAVKTSAMLAQVVEALGLMGLLLAVMGLYGLVAYSVSRRTREIGIRIAIGANRQRVVRMVLWQGLQLGVIGVGVGLVVAYFAGRGLGSLMWAGETYQVSPVTYVPIALTLLLISTLASWAPARRASRVDPVTALRDE